MIFIGTAGYSYKDWIGRVYPKGTQSKDMLGYYARKFNFTEVNSTFYRLPSKHMLWRMGQKTPEQFRFAVKAYQGLTHKREEAEGCVAEFRGALEGLIKQGKLACVLAQFPWSFKPSSENFVYLSWLRRSLMDVPLAAEFRNNRWVEERVFDFLRDTDIAYVCLDEPRLKGLMPPIARKTSSFAYVRFHGRNSQKWWHHEHPYERYDYLYTEEELSEWVPKIQDLTRDGSTVYVSMNNHYQGKSVINARMLARMLNLATREQSDPQAEAAEH